MTLIKDLSMTELSVQWHAFQVRIEKLEKRLNRMYGNDATKKDIADILSERGDQLKHQLQEALYSQESVEYWLRNRGTTQEQIQQWNIKPKYERFDNYDVIKT